MQHEIIASAGAGRMGRGLAVVFALAGHRVSLVDLKQREDATAYLDAATTEIRGTLEMLVACGMIGAGDVDRVATRVGYVGMDGADAALAEADVIFEGVPEVLDAKRAVFAFISDAAKPDAIIASTTSTILSDELQGMVSHPERFLNAHWLNPAYVIPLVEISPHAGTDLAVTESVQQLLESIGKVPVLCKPSPGYIVPRLQALVMNEAARLVQEGVASAEDVDRAVRLGFGMRYASMGLLEFVDFGGLDILYYASGYMSRTVDKHRYETPEIVEQKMKAGDIGVRTGKGLYDWSGVDVPDYRDQTVSRLVGLLRREGLFKPPVID